MKTFDSFFSDTTGHSKYGCMHTYNSLIIFYLFIIMSVNIWGIEKEFVILGDFNDMTVAFGPTY